VLGYGRLNLPEGCDLLKAAKQAEKHLPISDPRILELLKMISRVGVTAARSDEKKSHLLAQLKASMIFHSCPLIFLTLNPTETHSPIALFYTGEEIDVTEFDPFEYSPEQRLKRTVTNPLAVVEYFHSMITVIIEKVLKGGIFGKLAHHYGTIKYQGRKTSHIHLAV
jgi:Helitron helicase-like domain at N-terminus